MELLPLCWADTICSSVDAECHMLGVVGEVLSGSPAPTVQVEGRQAGERAGLLSLRPGSPQCHTSLIVGMDVRLQRQRRTVFPVSSP